MTRQFARVSSVLWVTGVVVAICVVRPVIVPRILAQQRPNAASEAGVGMTVVLGRPTDTSVALNVLAPSAMDAFVEVGIRPGEYTRRSTMVHAGAGVPVEIALESLDAGTRHYYRVRHRAPGSDTFQVMPERQFVTAPRRGTPFTFAVQGDSHPERDGRMFDSALYRRTLDLVAAGRPDFYVMLGDDFSTERLIASGRRSQTAVDAVYASQRSYLGRLTDATALFLVNGNHEEAARFLIDGTEDNPAVLAARARLRYYPLPAPDRFYSGDEEPEPHVGLLRDYYAWTWGDALFVVIDPYWHSVGPADRGAPDSPAGLAPVGTADRVEAPAAGAGAIDEAAGGGGAARARGGRGAGGPGRGGRRGGGGGGRGARRGGGANAAVAAGINRNLWAVTLGDAQYRWLARTLESSQARYKFVFAHHVLGTGRGGVEMADLYEWGGRDPGGRTTFAVERPTWPLPIHQLMVKTGVTIFFQGHDHLFARQEKDGVIYQEVPNPADPTYTAFNREAYRSGDVLPNAGHLRVDVAPSGVRVQYLRSYLQADERDGRRHGEVAFEYRLP